MRKTKKIIAKFTQIKTAINCIKIVLTSMFFSTKISHVVEELEHRELKRVSRSKGGRSSESRLHLHFSLKIRPEQLYSDDSKNPELYNEEKNKKHLIIDCTDVSVDINWFRKPVKQADLEGKDYRWGYSTKDCLWG